MKTASGSELALEANEFSKSDTGVAFRTAAKNDKMSFLENKADLGDRFRENQNAPGSV